MALSQLFILITNLIVVLVILITVRWNPADIKPHHIMIETEDLILNLHWAIQLSRNNTYYLLLMRSMIRPGHRDSDHCSGSVFYFSHFQNAS